MSDIESRLAKLVVNTLDAEPSKVVEAASFIDDLGADSIDHLDLLIAAEDEFDVEITDADWGGVQTFGQAVTLVSRLVEA